MYTTPSQKRLVFRRPPVAVPRGVTAVEIAAFCAVEGGGGLAYCQQFQNVRVLAILPLEGYVGQDARVHTLSNPP